jgi:hypothetical protein
MKRLAVAGAIAAVLASTVAVAPAFAASSGAAKDTSPVSFVLSATACPNLPAGTTVNGAGVEKSITRTRTSHDGVTTVANTTHAFGTAVDQDGNTYRFNYSNEFRVSNTLDDPATFSGKMTDSFSLAGAGPAKLHNGFLAVFTTDLGSSFAFQPIHSRGDPIDFTSGAAHCDPL